MTFLVLDTASQEADPCCQKSEADIQAHELEAQPARKAEHES